MPYRQHCNASHAKQTIAHTIFGCHGPNSKHHASLKGKPICIEKSRIPKNRRQCCDRSSFRTAKLVNQLPLQAVLRNSTGRRADVRQLAIDRNEPASMVMRWRNASLGAWFSLNSDKNFDLRYVSGTGHHSSTE